MQIICLKNPHSDPKVISTLNTILDHLGFFYSWQELDTSTKTNDLVLEYSPFKASDRKIKNCLCIPALFPPERITKKQTNWAETLLSAETIPVLRDSVIEKSHPFYYDYDIVSNVFYHLNRVEENIYNHPEQIDIYGSSSILHKYGDSQLPVVDILIDHFGQWLEQKSRELDFYIIKKAAYPNAEEFGLAITHDVDFIRAYHPLKKWYLKLGALLSKSSVNSAAEIEQLDRNKWGFDQLLPFYKQKKWPATFLFIAKNFEGVHQRYRIKSKRMRTVIKEIIADKHEIALHCSKYSFEHPLRYAREKRKLERIAGVKLKGMRHHYLRGLFPDLWKKAAQLDLEYETTLCHRRKSGFRSGTSRPYFIKSDDKSILVIPTNFFESTLPREGADVDTSLKEIKHLLSKIKKHNGLLTVLWHTNNITLPANYAAIWQKFIVLMEQENPFISTLSEHTNWIKQRNQIQIQSFDKQDNNYNVLLSFPSEMETFTLQVPAKSANYTIKETQVSCERQGEMLHVNNSRGQNQATLTISSL